MRIEKTEEGDPREKGRQQRDCYLGRGGGESNEECVNYKWALAISLYKGYHELLRLLTFNTPWKDFRVESRMRHSVFSEKLAGQVFRVRYSQEPVL